MSASNQSGGSELSQTQLFSLCTVPSIQQYIRHMDYQFYQTLVDVLMPNVLKSIPSWSSFFRFFLWLFTTLPSHYFILCNILIPVVFCWKLTTFFSRIILKIRVAIANNWWPDKVVQKLRNLVIVTQVVKQSNIFAFVFRRTYSADSQLCQRPGAVAERGHAGRSWCRPEN